LEGWAIDLRITFYKSGLPASISRGGLYEEVMAILMEEAGESGSREYVHEIACRANKCWPEFLHDFLQERWNSLSKGRETHRARNRFSPQQGEKRPRKK
jgi:hypothetical protein